MLKEASEKDYRHSSILRNYSISWPDFFKIFKFSKIFNFYILKNILIFSLDATHHSSYMVYPQLII